ncbi:hypothetical protein STEG23_018643 [Scotinomys teguina]
MWNLLTLWKASFLSSYALPKDNRNHTLKKSVTLCDIILQMVALMCKEGILTFPGSHPQQVETVLSKNPAWTVHWVLDAPTAEQLPTLGLDGTWSRHVLTSGLEMYELTINFLAVEEQRSPNASTHFHIFSIECAYYMPVLTKLYDNISKFQINPLRPREVKNLDRIHEHLS